MITITIQAGNTDNKLTQQVWSDYVSALDETIKKRADMIHFMGGAPNWMPWQNVCWVVNMYDAHSAFTLRREIVDVRGRFMQDGIAWTEGETEMA